ncbi:TPA: hypothetical protein ACY4SM_000981 [Clostridium perfringens]|uniref:hypothetical protein n=1 Tax=Clostridium perfringens TaxID=1502 RepID=UPI000F52F3E8|nr:hypothetical protein [Clostridium perfringens]EJT6341729.1 hypothetical protein [Clostridium perfringens]ELC8426128.1 hypothetical protein [Clostridium perfringens]ELQ0172913.1 hypothetical protein [Clostridium perfringens]ELU5587238.1 hypothetical protein [Clostridium perfringens]MBO3366952.1 hypothetical protein [Clostridium perfringens]
MKKVIKKTIIPILILVFTVTIITVSKILYEYIQLKQEIKLDSQKVEVNNSEINKDIEEMLTNLFEIGDAQLEKQEFFETYRKKTFENFYIDYDNENRAYVFHLIFRHFFHNIEENHNKENLKTNIKIENIYKISDNNYEVKFIVEKEFNYKDNPNIIKLEEEYYNALIINENNKYLIKEIYNIKDFNNYINREHEISKYYTKRSKLYTEYLIFKKGQYSDLGERYLNREEILNDGYII